MSEQAGLRRAAIALQHRDFRLFYIAALVGAFGSQVQSMANILQIYDLTHSPLQLGLTGLARAAPIIGLSLMGGVIADRIDRRRFIMTTQCLSGVVALALAALTASGLIAVWHIYLATLLSSALSAVNTPARSAMLPNLVPRQHLLNAIALQSTVWEGSNIIGPTIAGVLIATLGMPATYLVNGGALIVTVSCLALIRVGPIAARPRASAWRSLVEGLAFLRRRSIILALLGTDNAAMLFGSYRVLMPVFAAAFGVGPEGLGLMLAAPSVGSVLGATAVMSAGNFRYKGLVVVGAILAYCVALVVQGLSPLLAPAFPILWQIGAGDSMLLSVSPWFLLALAASFMLGLFDALQATPRNGVIQLVTPDELRGRVSSFQNMLVSGVPGLGQTLIGATASAIGAPFAVIAGAALCATTVLGITVARPDLRAADLGSVEPEAVPAKSL